MLTTTTLSFSNNVLYSITLSQTSPGFTCLRDRSYENILGKGEIARNKQIFLFPQCFLPLWKIPCHSHQLLLSANSFIFGRVLIACYEQFHLFPQCLLPLWKISCHFHQILNCHLQTLSLWKGLKFVVWERVKSQKSSSEIYSSCTLQILSFWSYTRFFLGSWVGLSVNLDPPGPAALNPLGFFCGNVLGQDTSELETRAGKPNKIHKYVSYHHNMPEIMLKKA